MAHTRDAWSADPDRTTRNGDTGPQDNPYAMGALEWHAWGAGHTYGLTHAYRDAPLSGKWAGDILPPDVILAAWKAVLGSTWDTYSDGSEEDRDADSDILDAWEGGFFTATHSL